MKKRKEKIGLPIHYVPYNVIISTKEVNLKKKINIVMKFINFKNIVITAGLAMFSMFFGSGNLVFPLIIGTQAMDCVGYSMLGLSITGILMPFLGLLGITLYEGNKRDFFATIGKKPSLFLIFIVLAILGPLGAIPRSIIVAYGGISLFLPNFPYWVFSIVFSLTTLLFLWNKNNIIPLLGRYMTPILLIGVIAILITGIFFCDLITPTGTLNKAEAFETGMYGGYQSMDLLTAFFFAATTINYLKQNINSSDSKKLIKFGIFASLIGMGMVGILCLSLLILGAKHADTLAHVNPEQFLVTIAGNLFGPIAIPIVGIILFTACLTTAVMLGMVFSDFLSEDICRSKLKRKQAVIITLFIGFLVSLVGFEALRLWMGHILKVICPALIILTIANIVCKIWKIPYFGRWGFWLTTIMSTIFYITK